MSVIMDDGSIESCFRHNFAIVSRVSWAFAEQSSFDLVDSKKKVDFENSVKQSEELRENLRHVGLQVIEMPSDDKCPDGVFIGDIAVVINGTALMCHPPDIKGRPSRQSEVAMLRSVLRREVGLTIKEVTSDKAEIEGSDVLWTGREIFVGIGQRTNTGGAASVAAAFPEWPTTVIPIPKGYVHLKDVVSMAGPDLMVIHNSEGGDRLMEEMKRGGSFGYSFLRVEEELASNVVYSNGYLFHLSGSLIPKAVSVYENKMAVPRITVNLSEAIKKRGRLSNCVLLISRVRKPKDLPIRSVNEVMWEMDPWERYKRSEKPIVTKRNFNK